MRSLIAVLALVLLAACNIGCQGSTGCGAGSPYVKIKPFWEFGNDPEFVDGPKRMIVNERRAYDMGVIDSGARCDPMERVGPAGYRKVGP